MERLDPRGIPVIGQPKPVCPICQRNIVQGQACFPVMVQAGGSVLFHGICVAGTLTRAGRKAAKEVRAQRGNGETGPRDEDETKEVGG